MDGFDLKLSRHKTQLAGDDSTDTSCRCIGTQKKLKRDFVSVTVVFGAEPFIFLHCLTGIRKLKTYSI